MAKSPSKLEHLDLREQIIATCIDMNASGLNQGTSGNVSARVEDGILITPSGLPYKDTRPEDIILMKNDGSVDHELVPSTEWRFHLDIHDARPDVGAVVHTHSTFATTIAILGRDIPAMHYMIAVSGGNSIRCARYETYGTPELSAAALEALEGRTCCLLGHHGMIATGSSLAKAYWLAGEMETLAKQYYYTLQLGGPPLLPDEEIENVLQRFKSYGPRAKPETAKDEPKAINPVMKKKKSKTKAA